MDPAPPEATPHSRPTAPASPGAAVPGPARDHGFDALRALAVLLMIAAHAARVVKRDARPEWAEQILVYEPFISGAFLVLVGASLSLSRHKFLMRWDRAAAPRGRGWFARQAGRALLLWLFSAVFYAVAYGPRLPDMFLLSGILGTIAYAILLVGACLTIPRPALLLGGVTLAGGALFVALDLSDRKVFPLNAGNCPWLPLVLFALLGALFALAVQRHGSKLHRWSLWGGALALALSLAWVPPDRLFTAPIGRSDASRTFERPAPPLAAQMLRSEKERPPRRVLRYYNPRPVLLVPIAGSLALLYGLFSLFASAPALGRMRSRLRGVWLGLLAPGRHSLGIYMLHLSLLGLLGGKGALKEPWQIHLVLASIVAVCYLYALGRDRMGRRSGAHPLRK